MYFQSRPVACAGDIPIMTTTQSHSFKQLTNDQLLELLRSQHDETWGYGPLGGNLQLKREANGARYLWHASPEGTGMRFEASMRISSMPTLYFRCDETIENVDQLGQVMDECEAQVLQQSQSMRFHRQGGFADTPVMLDALGVRCLIHVF